MHEEQERPPVPQEEPPVTAGATLAGSEDAPPAPQPDRPTGEQDPDRRGTTEPPLDLSDPQGAWDEVPG